MTPCSEDIVAMARAAQHDERLSDGDLYRKLADEIERLRNHLEAVPIEELEAAYVRRSRLPTSLILEEQEADEADILPCPFCGLQPHVEKTGFHLGGRTIRCETDDCMGPHTTASNVSDAVMQWNRRSPPLTSA